MAERAVRWRESGAGPPGRGGRAGGAGEGVARSAGGPVAEPDVEPEVPVEARTGTGVGGARGGTARSVGGPVAAPDAVPAETAVGVDAGADSGTAPVPAGAWRERAGMALRERMPVWLQARCGLEPRSVLALAVVLVVAAGFAVQHFWTGRTQPVRAPETVRAATPHGEDGPSGRRAAEHGPGAAADAARAPGTAGPEIVVDVSGKVRDPGIHRLPAGSRVADALRAAGGVRPGTDIDGLNRARFLVDGEQVVVGAPASATGTGAGGPAAGGPAGAAAGAGPAAPVSLNTATPEQLDTLPGVGPVLAQHIVDYRTRHGGFRSVEELREVNGIGDRRFSDLRDLVRP
ncbi:ComEA family DNA-binding protein [Streptomyces sp. NPDC052701]|uniref:ComEA family DNA-binding protein n=1 Tax=Streptomyces sp. NPDC052701 TaxID=3155533 RepID=UPI00344A108E